MSKYQETAREMIDNKEKFDKVMDSTEETLEEMGNDYGVEITEEGINRVRDEFCKKIIKSKEDNRDFSDLEFNNTPNGWVNGLHEDFENDRGRQSVSFVLSKASKGRDCLVKLSESIMARKYGNYSR